MLSPPLESQTVIPSATTSFLCPCNEDAVQEHVPNNTSKTKKKEFIRSYSCDVILPKKPHPFRSPMTYLRSTTLPRNYNSRRHDIQHNELQQFTLRFDESEWSLDEEYPVCSSQSNTATTDNTPFCGLSNQPYYARRQSASLGKLNKKKEKGSKSTSHVVYQPQSFDGHYATMRPQKKDKSDGSESESDSLRRRASSLDFLPETISKTCSQQNGGKPVPFGRTTSLSQRSPFRKKISHTAAEQETSLQGIKDYRPKGTKRLRSGLDALFDSIEKHDVDELRKILGTLDVNINELNADQFTPLDVALMCGEVEIASILLEHGGKENPKFVEAKDREEHLKKLIEVADGKVNDCNTSTPNSAGEAKDNDKQLREWEWKLLMLRIMYNKFLIMDCPKHIPTLTIAPLSNDSVVVTISPATEEFDIKNMVTKYKVEWSQSEDFSDIKDSMLLSDARQISCTISSLEKGVGWYFRVQSGNLKGFSPYGYPDPRVVHPSSWHECDLSLPRYYSTSEKLDQLVDQLLLFQKEMTEKTNDDENGEDESSVSPRPPDINDSPRHRHKKMAKGFSKYTNLIFNSAPKLLKKIKRRGIYLAALLYSEDYTHVLVTMDENLPVVECDENYSKTLTQEIYWFSKASCTWKDINHMLYFSTKSHSSHSVQIRRKLLQSALALMNATGVHDLGPIHYKPFKDNNGSILLLAVNCIKKHLSGSRSMAMKWIPITKLLKKTNSTNDQVMAPERLIPSVEEQVTCHRRSRMKLTRGLYLGYLKLRTSVDVLSIMVPDSHTNVLPFVKIQDIPNVTKEEWTWLKSSNTVTGQISTEESCQSVRTFEKRLKKALNTLFVQLNIEKETLMSHRIYDKEVIELSSEVLFLLVCPPCDDMCTPPNQPDGFTHLPDYSPLPFQAFEMSNMMTYQPTIMSAYCRLSSILELENYCMQQIVRQTICHKQLNHLKERQSRLVDFQQSVDELWRSSRWVFDTIQTCQDKNLNSGIRVASLYRTKSGGDWGECNGDVRCSLSSTGTTNSQSTDDFSGDVEVSLDCSFNSLRSEHVSLDSSKDVSINSSRCDQASFDSSKSDQASFNCSKSDQASFNCSKNDQAAFNCSKNDQASFNCTKSDQASFNCSKSDQTSFNRSVSDQASFNCSKSDRVLVIHGSKELGLDEMSCVEVQANERTTTCDLIKMATDQFSDETSKNDRCEGPATTGGGSGSGGGGGGECGGGLSDVRFCKQLFQQLCLVVVTGGNEVCLDDSNLVERPWSRGTTYLRLKKDSTNQQQPVGVGTTV